MAPALRQQTDMAKLAHYLPVNFLSLPSDNLLVLKSGYIRMNTYARERINPTNV